EAAASFEDQHYQSPLSGDIRWSRIAGAPQDALPLVVEKVWSKLASGVEAPETPYLGRIPSAIKLGPGMGGILEAARRAVVEMPLGTAQGRRDLALLFEDTVARSISSTKYTAEFASDENLVQLVLDLAAPRLGERIYDPCFGLGGFLAEAARRVI